MQLSLSLGLLGVLSQLASPVSAAYWLHARAGDGARLEDVNHIGQWKSDMGPVGGGFYFTVNVRNQWADVSTLKPLIFHFSDSLPVVRKAVGSRVYERKKVASVYSEWS